MNTLEYTFSASSYKEYEQCGLKFRYKRINRLPDTEEASHHRWFGRLVHDCVYTGLAERNGNKDFTLRDKASTRYATTTFSSVWDGSPKDRVGRDILIAAGQKPTEFSPGKIKALEDGKESEWKKVGRKMVSNGVKALSPVLPKIIELEKEIHFDYLGRQFVGFIDILTKNYEFYDLKTSWNKPGKGLDKDFQFFIYSYALKQIYNLPKYPKGNWVHLKDGSIIKFRVTEEIEEMHKKEAEILFQRLENDIYPASYNSPLCKFCDYRNICYEDVDWSTWKPESNR